MPDTPDWETIAGELGALPERPDCGACGLPWAECEGAQGNPLAHSYISGSPTMPDTLTEIRARHVETESTEDGTRVCAYDWTPWPCDEAQTLAHMDALYDEISDLRDELIDDAVWD